MRLFGQAAIWIALLMSAWAFTVYVAGTQRERSDLLRSGDRAILVVASSAIMATIVLVAGLLRHDFSMRYVATYSSLNLPGPYLVSALWSGQRGSLLLAAALLSILTALLVFTGRRRGERVHAALLSLILIVMFSVLCIALDPLGGLAWVPVDGVGMFPALQTPPAVIYPPLLLASYVAAASAGTGALASILRRSVDPDDAHRITSWSAIAWFLGTIGLLASWWWAYRDPAHAGSWLFFAMESGGILPWLALTLFLLVAALRSRRGHIPGWSLALVIAGMLLSGPAAALTTAAVAQAAGDAARSGMFITAAVAVSFAIGAAVILASNRAKSLPSAPRPRRTLPIAFAAGGLLLAAAAIGGTIARTSSLITVSVAEPEEVVDVFGAKWSFLSQGPSRYNELNREVDALALELQRNDESAGILTTEVRQYVDVQGEPIFAPAQKIGVRSTLREDVHVVLRDFGAEGSANLQVTITPLMIWFWIGGLMVAAAGAIALWPARSNESET